MPNLNYLSPSYPLPEGRYVAVVVHRDMKLGGIEKGYFYDSAGGDNGGSGPFDWRVSEAIERAKRYASENGIAQVVVKAQ